MIVIAIVATVGGGVYWRMSRLADIKRRETDLTRLRGVLSSSRMLAVNKNMDFELELQETKQGWTLRLLSLEEPALQYGCGQLSKIPIEFGEKKEGLQRVILQFFSTGHVAPSGVLKCGKVEIAIPGFFRQEEGEALGPLHPDELKAKKKS